nr:uncharacterized protein LOC109167506 [Ipomoea batatas]
MVEERRTSMDSTGKQANFGRDTCPPGGVGDDADEYPGSEEKSDGSGSEWYGSGEESDDTNEDYNYEDLVNIDVHDDDLFVKNIDVTTEFSGLSNVRRRKSSSKSKEVPQVQVKRSTSSPCEPQIQVAVEPQPNVSTEVQLEGQPQVQVEVDPQPDVITQVTQPEVEENEWEIPDEVLDDQWHQILIQAEDTCRGMLY